MNDMDEIDTQVKESVVFHFVRKFDEIPSLLLCEATQESESQTEIEISYIKTNESISTRI